MQQKLVDVRGWKRLRLRRERPKLPLSADILFRSHGRPPLDLSVYSLAREIKFCEQQQERYDYMER